MVLIFLEEPVRCYVKCICDYTIFSKLLPPLSILLSTINILTILYILFSTIPPQSSLDTPTGFRIQQSWATAVTNVGKVIGKKIKQE